MNEMFPIYGWALVDEHGKGELLGGRWTQEDAELEAQACSEEQGVKLRVAKVVTTEN